MRKLDWYIIKKFLSTFFFMIAAFCVIVIVFDLTENIDDLITNEAPISEIIIDYYVNFCFFFGNMLSAFIVFLTIILFTSRLAQNTEIVAILSGGISFNRFLRPYFIAATFLVMVGLLISHVILPEANKTKVDFQFKYIHTRFHISDQNMYREPVKGDLAYFRSISAEKNLGYKMALENWKDGAMVRKIMASKAKYYPEEHRWEVTNARIRDIHPDGTETLRHYDKIDTVFNMKIADFGQRDELISTMSYSELTDYIEKVSATGSGKTAFIEIEKHSRTSNPFSIYVLTLIGVSIAARKLRGGTGLHIFIAVIIGLTYIFCLKMATVAATNAGTPASIAVWIPNILFFILGLYIYKKAPK